MPYDPSLPAANALVSSAELRGQFAELTNSNFPASFPA
jgi:hypothetical protein